MNIKEINRQIQGGTTHVKAFPGAKSTQLNHYATTTLEEYSYDAAIIHAGVNDILRSKHYELDKISENIISGKYLSKVQHWKKIYISNTSINKNKY